MGTPLAHGRAASLLANALLITLALMPTGCMFVALDENLTRFNRLASLQGTVTSDGPLTAPVIVFLYQPETNAVVDAYTLTKPGAYFFPAPSGSYDVAAFEDSNHDRIYQVGHERAARLAHASPLTLAPGQHLTHLDLRLDGTTRLAASYAMPPPGHRALKDLPEVRVGTITRIDDPLFCDENAKRGMWEPVQFVSTVGAGVYFLEPYSEDKTPILFLHGIGGHPGQFANLIAAIDRSRFQPWLAYYPSGMSLELMGGAVRRWMEQLQAQLEFKNLVVVAHSMGGLVARAFINDSTDADGDSTFPGLSLFISISTPWGGHAAAAAGVAQAPVVMPVWQDMAPGSPFLAKLFTTPLPKGLEHHLLFTYRGRALTSGGANDRVVSLVSELDPQAQAQAKRLYGFDEDHVSVLSSRAAIDTIKTLLASID